MRSYYLRETQIFSMFSQIPPSTSQPGKSGSYWSGTFVFSLSVSLKFLNSNASAKRDWRRTKLKIFTWTRGTQKNLKLLTDFRCNFSDLRRKANKRTDVATRCGPSKTFRGRTFPGLGSIAGPCERHNCKWWLGFLCRSSSSCLGFHNLRSPFLLAWEVGDAISWILQQFSWNSC